MSSKKKVVHLALQGGGAHGAFAWGIIDKLLEDGRISFDGICAASAGSVNAVAYAHGLTLSGVDGARESLHNIWKEISKNGMSPQTAFSDNSASEMKEASFSMFNTMTRTLSPYEFNPLNLNSLKTILDKMIDFDAIKKKKKVKLFLSATNVRTGKVKIFDTDSLSVEVVLASACLPFLFQAQKVGSEYYWDGGYMGNPPLFPLFYTGTSQDVIVVHINPIERSKLPTKANEINHRVTEITFNASLLKEMRAVAFVDKIISKGWIKDEFKHHLRQIYMHSIRADKALIDFSYSSKFDTSWSFLTYLRDLGKNTAEDWLRKNYNCIGHRSSVDLKQEFLGTGIEFSD